MLTILIAFLLSPLWVPVYILYAIFALLFPVRFTQWFIFNVPGASWQVGDLEPEKVQEAHKSAPQMSELPKSGDLVEYDFRKKTGKTNPDEGQNIKVISYNVYLAQNLNGVIQELLRIDPAPDVIFLQEDNIYMLPPQQSGDYGSTAQTNETSFHHAGGEIAKTLNMSCVFVNAHYRGGGDHEMDGECTGLYGMAILSRFKLRNTKALKCETQPWIVDQMAKTWLKGERHFPYAEIGEGEHTIALSSVHLPSVGKYHEKTQMMSNLFKQLKGATVQQQMLQRPIPSIIGGDMNTAPFFFRWLLPFGSNDLFFSCARETDLFRRFIDSNNFMDPFSNEDGTFVFPGGSVDKLDWILLERNYFQVKSFEVEDASTKYASDHCWISVTCSLIPREEKKIWSKSSTGTT